MPPIGTGQHHHHPSKVTFNFTLPTITNDDDNNNNNKIGFGGGPKWMRSPFMLEVGGASKSGESQSEQVMCTLEPTNCTGSDVS